MLGLGCRSSISGTAAAHRAQGAGIDVAVSKDGEKTRRAASLQRFTPRLISWRAGWALCGTISYRREFPVSVSSDDGAPAAKKKKRKRKIQAVYEPEWSRWLGEMLGLAGLGWK
jgi:hypothetical protein